MLERTAGSKILILAVLAAGLVVFPLSTKAQQSSRSPSQSGQSAVKGKTASSPGTGDQTLKASKPPTEAQLAARERRVKCGAEWREAKEKGAVEEGATWPKYWSACNKRIKDYHA